MKFPRTALAVVLALHGVAALAQSVPKPKEFYFDPDANARLIVVAQGQGDALAQELLKERERGRKRVEATAQLAHVAMAENRLELGKQLYQQAMQSTQPNSGSGLGRAVRWNYAWDLYRSGEPEPALQLWAALAAGYGEPAWVPPTMALALWSTGRKAEAVKWYAAAVRTEPMQWGSAANFPTLLPDWRDAERAILAEVQAAWQANPPSWP